MHGCRHALRTTVALLTLLWLAGCVTTREHETPENLAARQTIIETALGQIGRPYRYGGDDPSGFDCSGLVAYSYRAAGISVPHNTGELRSAGTHISMRDAQPGDVLLYNFANRLFPSLHVAIYLGDGKMVHAPAAGGEVQATTVEHAPWPDIFVTALRLLP